MIMDDVQLSIGATPPYRAQEVATVYGIPTLPTEDGKGQGWAYIYANLDCVDVTNDQQWEIAGQLVERFNTYHANQSEIARLRTALARLIEAADNMGWSANSSAADEAINDARTALRVGLEQQGGV
jgi:hypothetical protein